jgi:hypothetical protein
MAKSGLIDLRSKRAAAGDAGRQPRVATNLTMRPQKTRSTTAEDPLSLSNGGGKIVRLYPRAVAPREKPALPMWDKNGESNVICFPEVPPNSRGDDDYRHRMWENALAAAVLLVLMISGQWIFSTLATIP